MNRRCMRHEAWRAGRRLRLEQLDQRLALSANPIHECNSVVPVDWPEMQSVVPFDIDLSTVHAMTGLDTARQQYGLSGAGQTVAIIDSGLAYDHDALGGGFGADYRVVGGWDFTEENDGDPYDDPPGGFHGTHVAGIVASDDPSHPGVAPSADLVALRVFNDQGHGNFEWVEQALRWVHRNRDAFENPITTVNLSLGSIWNSDAIPGWASLEDELAQLHDDGMFVSVAAGNSFGSYHVPGLSYPAASPYVIPVASIDQAGNLSHFSQRSSRVLAAPGNSIISTVPDYLFDFNGVTDDFLAMSGTSMAAPYVAGAAVLLREAMLQTGREAIGQDELYEHFVATSDITFDPSTGIEYYRLNVQSALDAVLEAQAGKEAWIGAVDFHSFDADSPAPRRIAFEAVRDGIFTIQVTSPVTSDFELFVHDDEGQRLASWTGGSGTPRIDFVAEANETYQVTVLDQVSMTLANLVHVTDHGHWQIFGTDGDDRIDLNLHSERLSINGIVYTRDLSNFVRMHIAGQSGTDSIRVRGTPSNELVELRPGYVSMVNEGASVKATDFESIQVIADQGSDIARVFGSTGNDRFIGKPDYSILTNAKTGHRLRVDGFDRVYSRGEGGADRAFLYGSNGDDRFFGKPRYSILRGRDYQYYTYVAGYDRVVAEVDSAGDDRAFLYGSEASDRLIAKSSYTIIRDTKHSFYNYVVGFDRVSSRGVEGGHDVAYVYRNSPTDVLSRRGEFQIYRGPSFEYFNRIAQFDRVRAFFDSTALAEPLRDKTTQALHTAELPRSPVMASELLANVSRFPQASPAAVDAVLANL